MHIKRSITLALLIVLMIAAGSATAQGGLPADQQAIRDRALSALETAVARDQYTVFLAVQDAQYVQLKEGTAAQANRSDVIETDREIRYLRTGDGENIAQVITVRRTRLDVDGRRIVIALQGETRQVDGVLYVRAIYTEGAGDLPALPAAWIVVDADAFARYPGLDLLDLREMLRGIETGSNAPVTAADIELLRDYAVEVMVTGPDSGADQDDMFDARVVERIDITFAGEGVIAQMQTNSNPDDPAERAFLAALEPLPGQVLLGLDETGILRSLGWLIPLNVVDVAADVIDPDLPPETRADVVGTQMIAVRFDVFDAPAEPITAPSIDQP